MVTLRVRPHTLYTRTTYLARSRQLRWVHNPVLSWADEASHEAHLKLKTPNRELSLLEELFPEEVKKSPNRNNCANSKNDDLPRLPLPDIDDEQAQARAQRKLMTRAASAGAFRQSLMTVLLLSQASKTLVESDFRRIAPKGKHIEEWKGPGDILKVIPGRDPETLEPLGHYFLIFPNPAYARAYQNHVIHLHQLAQTHTPTSLESPMVPPPGMLIGGEDVYSMLQDYTLCPPSQKILLRLLYPPYAHNIKRILENKGYPQLVLPSNKAGRAVLFWVNGYQLSTFAIKNFLVKDGQDRGVPWGAITDKGSIEVVEPPQLKQEGLASLGYEQDEELKPKRRSFLRWIIAFENEAEARRFARTWHRRPFPLPSESRSYGEPPPLVHAEFMW